MVSPDNFECRARWPDLIGLASPRNTGGSSCVWTLRSSPYIRQYWPLLTVARACARRPRRPLCKGPGHASTRAEAGLTSALAGPTMETAFRAAENDERFAKPRLPTRRSMFSQIILPAKLVDLERVVRGWQPHLISHECTDLAAPIAAAGIGVPAVSRGWGLVPVPGQTVPNPSDVIALWRSRGLEP